MEVSLAICILCPPHRGEGEEEEEEEEEEEDGGCICFLSLPNERVGIINDTLLVDAHN